MCDRQANGEPWSLVTHTLCRETHLGNAINLKHPLPCRKDKMAFGHLCVSLHCVKLHVKVYLIRRDNNICAFPSVYQRRFIDFVATPNVLTLFKIVKITSIFKSALVTCNICSAKTHTLGINLKHPLRCRIDKMAFGH